MQTTVETLGQLERRLSVAIPVKDIEGEVEKRLTRMARTAKVPGFRPGKVPLKMMAQQYGSQLRSEVISDRVQEQFNDVVRDQNLRVAGNPRIEPRTEAATPGSDAIEFLATFEVYPDIQLGDLASLTIETPEVTVQPDDVDRTLDKLRLQRATWVAATHPAQKADRAVVDFTGTIDGEEFAGGKAEAFSVGVGEGQMLPEFDTAILGMAPGETRVFPLTFPADYHGKEVAGKQAQFTLTMKTLESPVLPALDDHFASEFGVAKGTVADLRAEVEQNLAVELKRKVETLVKEQVLRGLRSKADFAVPSSLVDMEAMNMLQRTGQNLVQQGIKRDDIRLTLDMFRSQATERVTLGLVLAELIERNGLAAKADQVRARVTEAAQTYEQPEAVVRWHYEQPERLADFEAAVAEQNVVDWVLKQAKVVPTPRAFDDVMNPPGGARSSA